MRTIFAEYNPHRNSIDVYTSAGYMLRIDCWEHSPCYILQFTFLFGYVHTIHIIRLNTSCCVLTVD